MALRNQLYYGDNLAVLRQYVKDESVDLVYLDPPFNSNRSYNVIFGRREVVQDINAAQIQAFDDTWHWTSVTEGQYNDLITTAPGAVSDALEAFRKLLGENDVMAYLVNMAPRLVELHRVLKPSGSLFLHCDQTASHYLKILLDAVFDPRCFRNEIIWSYRRWPDKRAQRFQRMHDTMLYYVKTSDGSATFNVFYEDVSESSKKRFKGKRQTLDAGTGSRKTVSDEDSDGLPRRDVWEMPILAGNSAERLGYPTQKPLALLERIIETASNEGDVVLDPFCGCGTTVDAAQRLNRHWIGIDITFVAVDLIRKRLQHTHGKSVLKEFDVNGIPMDVASAQALFQQSPLDFERWAVSLVNAQPNKRQVGDKGSDGTARFMLDAQGSVGKITISVKGGKSLNPSMVRDLKGTVETERAQMGILITIGEPTKGMIEAINRGGVYDHLPTKEQYPVLQQISIGDLLAGKLPKMPNTILPYIQAQRQKASLEEDQQAFF